MNPIRREVLNGLFVIVLSTLLSAAIAAFQVKFDIQLWVWIVMAVATAVTGYVIFEFAIGFMTSTEEREKASEESTRRREEEWLKRIGTPARLEMNIEGAPAGAYLTLEALSALSPGVDFTVFTYFDSQGGGALEVNREAYSIRDKTIGSILERIKGGTLREYKRIICFDDEVFVNDPELRSGVLRVGEGAGTVDRPMGEHCRLMMKTKGCSLFVAPAILQNTVLLYGTDKVVMTLETATGVRGGRKFAGALVFCDPPNSEIIEQFRQIERATERRMVAVHKIGFPEDAVSTVPAENSEKQ